MSAEFERDLDVYAELALNIGLNLQPGQRLLIGTPFAPTPFEAAPLVRRIAVKAYAMGARLVEVIWDDEQLSLIRVKHAAEDTLDEVVEWQFQAVTEAVQRGDARLIILGRDPDLFRGQDAQRIGRLQRAMVQRYAPIEELNPAFATNWLVIGVPTPGWARRVFPDLPAEEATARLWQAIFEVCRVKQPDPVQAWRQHLRQLAERSQYLNQRQFTALKYRAPGTELTVGLPVGHIWQGGLGKNRAGVQFAANMPTDEVYTLPHRAQVDGVVAATRPFSYGGSLIEEARFTFAEGKVVDFTARRGVEALRNLFETDDGARCLGEAALTPHSAPVSQSGLIFYNILFDENAACHFALGDAYRDSLEDGVDMSKEQFLAAGGNVSNIHLDFMIGSSELDVDGVRRDGALEPILRRGEWAFEV